MKSIGLATEVARRSERGRATSRVGHSWSQTRFREGTKVVARRRACGSLTSIATRSNHIADVSRPRDGTPAARRPGATISPMTTTDLTRDVGGVHV